MNRNSYFKILFRNLMLFLIVFSVSFGMLYFRFLISNPPNCSEEFRLSDIPSWIFTWTFIFTTVFFILWASEPEEERSTLELNKGGEENE